MNMKIVRRILIVLLLIANIGLLYYYDNYIEEPLQTINPANVTVVEAREQTEAEEHPAFIVEEYKLVLPEGENVALNKSITANSFTEVYNAPKAVDGTSDGPSYWEGTGEYPNTLTIDLGSQIKIHTIRLALNPLAIWGKRTQTVAVNISIDGDNFTELLPAKQYTFDPVIGNEAQLPFEEVETQFVQLVITENSGAGGGQIAEFEVYSK
ncbi:MAG: coagulation factor 5/8 type domain protein [Herbinix sp.]|nr:coagulation factor 5/8 type domain protein [Herbinix sp.]